ncbi:MAG TPA: hypothetical protein VK731_05820, partial [Candidatus Cybelea sp.]|nr:hypothetical protein [Candidatus Cybelea sp.]
MKLDRLLSRIRAALQGYATEFEQRALAAEYADLCAKAAYRLEQVVPLIREGQDFPALQIAESPPSVLDLIRQLSFAEAEQWRAYCHQRALPVATPFDERSVDLVNQLYSKKISETHPLYREYRQAIRTRRDEQALRVLKSIRRINHDDANAHAEFARLAHKLFERRRGELAAALDHKDTGAILALMETLEIDDWPGRENDSTWQRAVKFREEQQLAEARSRCLELLEQLRLLRAENRWTDASPLLAEWDSLRSQFTFMLPDEIETEANGAREWAAALLNERVRDMERTRSWRSITARLDELGIQNPAKKSTHNLKADLAELAEKATTLSAPGNDGHNAPPPEILQRIAAETAKLQRQLRVRNLRRAGAIFMAAAAVLVLVAVGIGAYMRKVNRVALLTDVEKHYQEGAAGTLADSLKSYDAQFSSPPSDQAWAKLLADARDYDKSHLAALDRFNAELSLARQAAAKPTPNQIAALFTSLDNLDKDSADLGTDDAQHAKAALQELRLQLNQKLAGDQDVRAAHLADIFARANQIVVDKLTGP